METVESKGKSRKSHRKSREKQGRQATHSRTACFGGFEEGQVICCLWEIIKSIETGWAVGTAGVGRLRKLEKQMRGRIRVEMQRYFARRQHRTIRVTVGILAVTLSLAGIFMFLVEVDRVTRTSMRPYLNDGGWIVYNRIRKGFGRDDVVVSERDRGCMVRRIAGLPGDTVRMNASRSRVMVNGAQIRESYMILAGMEQMETEDRLGTELMVMNGRYLVLEDNQRESIGSRDSDIGTVAEEEVLGRVMWITRAERQMMV